AVAHDRVLLERDLAAAGRADLLEPSEAPAVGVEAGDEVGQAVAVHVDREDLRAALLRELKGVERPIIAPAAGRLLEPAVVEDQVEAAVAVDVGDAGAVIKLVVVAGGGDGLEAPGLRRVGPVGGEHAPAIVPVADEL